MLSKKDREEFVKDGRSKRRRIAFAKARQMGQRACASLDGYIDFLMSVQKMFPFRGNKKKTITTLNKL